MAKTILGAVVSPFTTLLGVGNPFAKKKAAAPAPAATTPAKKPAFSPIITPLGGSTPAPSSLPRPPAQLLGSTILSDKLGG